MNPAKYLDRIYDIRRNANKVEEPYDVFVYFNERSQTLKDIFTYLYDKKSAEVQAAIANMNSEAIGENHNFDDIESIAY